MRREKLRAQVPGSFKAEGAQPLHPGLLQTADGPCARCACGPSRQSPHSVALTAVSDAVVQCRACSVPFQNPRYVWYVSTCRFSIDPVINQQISHNVNS